MTAVDPARDSYEMTIPPMPGLVAHIRRETRRFCDSAGVGGPQDGFADDAALVASELVANALRHASSQVAVRLSVSDTHLRLEVDDDDPTAWPSVIDSGPDLVGGHGLVVVDRLAERWGAEPKGETGKTVWCELALER